MRTIFISFATLTVVTTIICKEQQTADEENVLQDKEIVLQYKEDNLARTILPNYYWLIGGSMIALQARTLFSLGQPIISKSGNVQLWCGDVYGPENSQHLTDWYTFTHILHGLGYYWIQNLILPKASMDLRFLFAIAIEVVWEMFENSPTIINRYRRTALAQGYSGDSIINSVSDTVAMALGFYLSRTFPAPVMVLLAISSELLSAYMIRDNLTLNMIQLIYPLDVISRWQARLQLNN